MFKKIVSIVLCLMMCLSCVAFASTTQARSNTVKVTVLAYEINAGYEESNADKNTDPDTVMTELEINRSNYDNVDWVIEGTPFGGSGHSFNVTAEMITEGVTESCTKTIKVLANVKNELGERADNLEIELTYKIVWAGQTIDDEEEVEEDGENLQTEGDFMVTMTAPSEVWEGDPITYRCTPDISKNLSELINVEGITYNVYVANSKGTIIARLTADVGTAVNVAVEDETYKIWAVGTLSYTVKEDSPIIDFDK